MPEDCEIVDEDRPGQLSSHAVRIPRKRISLAGQFTCLLTGRAASITLGRYRRTMLGVMASMSCDDPIRSKTGQAIVSRDCYQRDALCRFYHGASVTGWLLNNVIVADCKPSRRRRRSLRVCATCCYGCGTAACSINKRSHYLSNRLERRRVPGGFSLAGHPARKHSIHPAI